MQRGPEEATRPLGLHSGKIWGLGEQNATKSGGRSQGSLALKGTSSQWV